MTGAFDLCGPLPEGVTVLEASAGTGKTFTIAALAARYVAEGRPLRDLLIVTFTRMATGELRERVRERLVESERGLATGAAQDEVVRLQARGSAVEVAERRERLARAPPTSRGHHHHHPRLCQEVLGGLGVAADAERDAVFMEDVSDLLEEVVDDLYVRRFRAETTPLSTAVRPAGSRRRRWTTPARRSSRPARTACRGCAGASSSPCATSSRRAAPGRADDLRRPAHPARRHARGTGPQTAARRLAQRYPIALVDEFQPDPIQWEILRRAFARGTLVLSATPAGHLRLPRRRRLRLPRGGAERCAQATLTVNRRSDQHLLDAYDELFGGAQLGHPGIVYRRVRAAHPGSRLPGAALRVRIVPRDAVDRTPQGYAQKPSSRAHIAKDVAADIVGLLDEGEVQPGDVAVLVRQNRAAAAIRDELSGPRSLPSSAGRAASSRPPRRPSGCACSKRLSGPPTPAGRTGRRSRHSSAGRPSESPPRATTPGRRSTGASRLDAGAARARRRLAARGDHPHRGAARAGARPGRRRAANDRPPPRRPAAVRGRHHRAARRHGAGRLAAPPDRRRAA